MSCEVNEKIKENLFDMYYQTLIASGLTSEQALKEIDKMFYEFMQLKNLSAKRVGYLNFTRNAVMVRQTTLKNVVVPLNIDLRSSFKH
jgi:hypothetical protein